MANSPTPAGARSSPPRKRIRRTPEEAKQLILDTAALKLKTEGLEGLNLTSVGDAAGISHATIIHHFGSSDGMRQALAEHMTTTLLGDVMTALRQDVPPETLCQDLFRAIIDNGHARLMAWMAVDGKHRQPEAETGIRVLFDRVIAQVAQVLHRPATTPTNAVADVAAAKPAPEELDRARNIVLLIAATAMGLGIGGDRLGQVLGMDNPATGDFPRWLADLVTSHAGERNRDS